MSTILIESELDMDVAIAHIMVLADLKGTKNLTIVFPSYGLHEIFFRNLYSRLIEEDVEIPVDIEIQIVISE